MRSSAHGRFLALDGLRGFAAIAVALFHFNRKLMPGGYLAVDLFFVLSGFVLVNSYAHRLNAELSAWRFIRLRVVRLYPLHLAGIALGIPVALAAMLGNMRGHLSVGEFLSSAVLNPLMLPTPVGSRLFPLNGSAWSLFFELAVNVVMAVFLIKLRLRGLLVVVTVAGVILAGLAIYTPIAHDPNVSANSAIIGGPNWKSFDMGIARTLFSFSVGMALANMPRGATRVQRAWALPSCLLLLILLGLPVSAEWRLAFDLAVVFLVSPLIVYWCSRLEPDRRFAPFASFVGELSFAVYAINAPAAATFRFIESRTHSSDVVMAPVYLGVSFAVAWCAVRWFDIPARRALGRWILR